MSDRFRQKLDYILKHTVWIYTIFKCTLSVFFKFIGLFVHLDQRAVMFSGHGRKYNDSPRAIYEYMLSHDEYSGLRYYWALEDPDQVDIPGKCTKVKTDTFNYFILTLKCKYWITCVNIERGLKYKKKKTIYLNTWHGTPIKSIAGDDNRKNDDFSYIDYFCVSGEFEKKIFQEVFSVKEEHMLYTGLPRNDELYYVSKDEISEIKNKLNIPEGKRVVLYAPTWRDSTDGGKTYGMKPPINIKRWEKVLGEDCVLLLRTHPYTNKLLGIEFNDFIRDYTNYPAINDLLKVSDILVSDYSATIFDFSILERPIICFGYDYDEYKKNRGFSLDAETELPGGILKSEEEVLDRIVNCDYKKASEETIKFKNKYLEYGGNATETCVKIMFG